MESVFIDTNILLYALNPVGASELTTACKRFVSELVAEDRVETHLSINVLQEYVHVCRCKNIDMKSIEREVGSIVDLVDAVHESNLDDFKRSLQILRKHEIDTMDALHIATALNRGVRRVITADRRYSRVSEATTIDPRDQSLFETRRGSIGGG